MSSFTLGDLHGRPKAAGWLSPALTALAISLVCAAAGAGLTHASSRKVELFLGAVVVGAGFFAVSQLGFASITMFVVLEPALFAFARYPRAHALVTFDRLWPVAALSCLLVAPRVVANARADRTVMLCGAWFVIAFGCRAITTTPRMRAIETWFDALVLPAVLFLLARAYVRTIGDTVRVARAFAAAGAILAVVGILERLLGFELASLSGGTPRYDLAIAATRVSGPYAVPEVYALALLICLAATLFWVQTTPAGAVIGRCIVVCEIGAIGLTFFRAAWLAALVVVFAAYGLGRARFTRTATTAIVVGTAALLLYSQLSHLAAVSTRIHNTSNVSTRFATYHEAYAIFKGAPFFGVGVNRYTERALALPTEEVSGADAVPYPHSSFMGLLAEQGVVGIVPFLALLGAIALMLRTFKRWETNDADRTLAGCTIGAAMAYVLMSLGLTMLPYGPSNALLAILLGVVAGRSVGETPVEVAAT
jgi:hypothetical protein